MLRRGFSTSGSPGASDGSRRTSEIGAVMCALATQPGDDKPADAARAASRQPHAGCLLGVMWAVLLESPPSTSARLLRAPHCRRGRKRSPDQERVVAICGVNQKRVQFTCPRWPSSSSPAAPRAACRGAAPGAGVTQDRGKLRVAAAGAQPLLTPAAPPVQSTARSAYLDTPLKATARVQRQAQRCAGAAARRRAPLRPGSLGAAPPRRPWRGARAGAARAGCCCWARCRAPPPLGRMLQATA